MLHQPIIRSAAVVALACCAVWPVSASAQSEQAGPWRFGASIYGYLPKVDGASSAPADSGGTSINVSGEQIFDALDMMFMSSLSAHNGRWGGFTDLMYLDLSSSQAQSRDFTIGNVGLPASTTANLGFSLKGLVWMLSGEYRLHSEPGLTLDLLAGTRLLDIRQTLNWDITGNIGPLLPAGRRGNAETRIQHWDAIVGLKGRASFGERRQWSTPFHVDIGTGESDLTWQMAGGISYAFKWGELTGMWRYLAYEMKAGETLQKLNFNGPMIGATFRW